jgi:hypothetical protein
MAGRALALANRMALSSTVRVACARCLWQRLSKRVIAWPFRRCFRLEYFIECTGGFPISASVIATNTHLVRSSIATSADMRGIQRKIG